MSSTATAHRLFATRPRSGVLVDVAISAAALVGSLLLISHGGIPRSAADTDLDWLGILLVGCASAPLIAWRRSPIGVFAVITVASAVLVGLGYPFGIPLGSGAALYLLAASRDQEHPWTGRATVTVVGLFAAYVVAAGVEQGASRGASCSTADLPSRSPGSPANERGCGASRSPTSSSVPCAPSARPSGSVGSRSQKNASGSPATSMTPPATPST